MNRTPTRPTISLQNPVFIPMPPTRYQAGSFSRPTSPRLVFGHHLRPRAGSTGSLEWLDLQEAQSPPLSRLLESLEASKRSAKSLSRMTGANQSSVSLAPSIRTTTSVRGNATKSSGQMVTSRSHPALPTGHGSLARRPSHKQNESSGTIGRGYAKKLRNSQGLY